MKRRGPTVAEAIDRLAELFEYGALEAATDPAGFILRVADEITALRHTPPATGAAQREACAAAIRALPAPEVPE